jgi:16S rRNA (uracil1498-N3)-methyltransferase
VAVRITRLRRAEPVRPLLTVATAVPKGKRWQQLVEKCTELGASRIRPVRFRQSVAEGGSDPAKWRRWAVEAAKQCGRAWLPEVPAPVDLGAFLGEADAGVAYVCDPRGEPLLKFAAHMGVAEAVTVLVGPEAGLMPEEAELCREHGLAPLRLGPHVLRIETAAQAACAAVRALLQE